MNMAKEFSFRGKSVEEIKKMSINEFAELLPSRRRRSLKRGFTPMQKALLKKVSSGDKDIETHCRNMIIIPPMLDKIIKVYNGKEFQALVINEEMLGHYLGEFVLTRHGVKHSAPGVGATRSSAALSVR
ncbi:MAG: 30S ribosomal protein S19 [Candidatus Woesearchaeota archaeon]|nr:30S ribosomal protein S19 [Candidatus Woesearchaeota archaeon]